MIPADKQREILQAAVPKLTEAVLHAVDEHLPLATKADKCGMAASILSHGLAVLLAEQPVEEQERLAYMIGDLIRQAG